MSIVPYVPTPIFGDRDTVIDQIKAIQNGESAESLINKWLHTCFAHTKISLPDFANTDYGVPCAYPIFFTDNMQGFY